MSTSEPKASIMKSRWTKWIIVAIVVIILIIIGMVIRKNLIAATVNGSAISLREVDSILEKQGGKQALDSLIAKKLVTQELAKQKVTVSKDEVNTEIAQMEKEMTAQGGNFDSILTEQGMTRADLVEQITIQKKIEKLLADKAVVTDQDIDAAIKANKLTPQKDETTETFRDRIKSQLSQQKFAQAANQWVSGLRNDAKISYYKTF